jgi:hypothetical protein
VPQPKIIFKCNFLIKICFVALATSYKQCSWVLDCNTYFSKPLSSALCSNLVVWTVPLISASSPDTSDPQVCCAVTSLSGQSLWYQLAHQTHQIDPQAAVFHFQDYANASSLHFYHFMISVFFLFFIVLSFSSLSSDSLPPFSDSSSSRYILLLCCFQSGLEVIVGWSLFSLYPHTLVRLISSPHGLYPSSFYYRDFRFRPPLHPLVYNISSFFIYTSLILVPFFFASITASHVCWCRQRVFN